MSYTPFQLAAQAPSNPTSDGVTAAASIRAVVAAVASVTPHTAGAWVEVDAALAADCSGIVVAITGSTNSTGADSSTLLEIGTGASSSEVVWATIGVGFLNPGGVVAMITVPGFIAAGTRVAVRARSVIASQQVIAVYSFLPTKTLAPAAPTTYGADTATSRGTTITAPGALNTKGAWTQIAASTAVEHGLVLVCPQGAAGTAMAASGVLIDIGIGGSGSEAVLIGDIAIVGSTAELYQARSPLTYGVPIPAGSRLSARYARANTGNAVDLVLVAA